MTAKNTLRVPVIDWPGPTALGSVDRTCSAVLFEDDAVSEVVPAVVRRPRVRSAPRVGLRSALNATQRLAGSDDGEHWRKNETQPFSFLSLSLHGRTYSTEARVWHSYDRPGEKALFFYPSLSLKRSQVSSIQFGNPAAIHLAPRLKRMVFFLPVWLFG